jgi:hypothetical protein
MGQQVRCPVCQTIFDAGANGAPAHAPEAAASGSPAPQPDSERPLWKDLNLELDKSDANGASAPESQPAPAPAPAPSRRGLSGAIELDPSGQPAAPSAPAPSSPPRRPEAPPPPRRPGPSDPRSRRYPNDYNDEDHPGSRRPYYRRRDTEPHRGVMVLVFGIISLVCVLANLCYGLGILVGIPLGIVAWVMGHGDLRKIKNHEMDDEGLGMTQAGWICGIIGTILNTLVLLSCGGLFAVMLIVEANRAAAAKPAFAPPVVKPAPPPPVRGFKDE